jgi:hypothetical protein
LPHDALGGEEEEAAIDRSILRVARDPDWATALGHRVRAFAAEAHSFEFAAAG